MSASAPRWDIFCAVVDNYGDAGVAWRLARQLTREHGIGARLWVDQLAPLARLAPQIDATREAQTVQGVEVRRWDRGGTEPGAIAGEVVIEAFGCGLPAAPCSLGRDSTPHWSRRRQTAAPSSWKKPRPTWLRFAPVCVTFDS